MFRLCTALTLLCLPGCVSPASNLPPVETVAAVDLTRYAGTWFEIARYPVWFERGCTGVTATYELRDDGSVTVTNVCREGSLDGPVDTIVGRARPADESGAKLLVSFFGPFEADYWVIDLDSDYQWAVVGNPQRTTLWILSRTPSLDDETVAGILERVAAQGFDPERLTWTPQPAE